MIPPAALPTRALTSETHLRAASRLADLARRARLSAAPVLAARLAAYAEGAERASDLGGDGLCAARATLAEDLRRYEAIALASPLLDLTRDALAAVMEAA